MSLVKSRLAEAISINCHSSSSSLLCYAVPVNSEYPRKAERSVCDLGPKTLKVYVYFRIYLEHGSQTQSLSVFALVDVGFEIPNHFVVGYALDYNEYFRDLNVSLLTLPHGARDLLKS